MTYFVPRIRERPGDRRAPSPRGRRSFTIVQETKSLWMKSNASRFEGIQFQESHAPVFLEIVGKLAEYCLKDTTKEILQIAEVDSKERPMDWWQQILGTSWIGSLISLVGLVVGVVSFTAAILLYRASRIGGRLMYQQQALTLLSAGPHELPSEVQIFYKGRAVPRVTRTLLVLWNSGKALIRGSDVVHEDPIQFAFSHDSEVLRVRVVRVSRTHIKIEALPTNTNTVTCQFDYLDQGDGAVLEILHTDEKKYPNVSGTVRGLPDGLIDGGRLLFSKRTRLFRALSSRTMLFSMIVVGVAFMGFGLIGPHALIPPQASTTEARLDRWVMIALGALYSAFPGLMLWMRRRRFPRRLLVEDLGE